MSKECSGRRAWVDATLAPKVAAYGEQNNLPFNRALNALLQEQLSRLDDPEKAPAQVNHLQQVLSRVDMWGELLEAGMIEVIAGSARDRLELSRDAELKEASKQLKAQLSIVFDQVRKEWHERQE